VIDVGAVAGGTAARWPAANSRPEALVACGGAAAGAWWPALTSAARWPAAARWLSVRRSALGGRRGRWRRGGRWRGGAVAGCQRSAVAAGTHFLQRRGGRRRGGWRLAAGARGLRRHCGFLCGRRLSAGAVAGGSAAGGATTANARLSRPEAARLPAL